MDTIIKLVNERKTSTKVRFLMIVLLKLHKSGWHKSSEHIQEFQRAKSDHTVRHKLTMNKRQKYTKEDPISDFDNNKSDGIKREFTETSFDESPETPKVRKVQNYI